MAADRASVTPSVVLLAAFADVLRGWAAEPDFTLNVTAFNRLPVTPEVTRLAGDFTSMIFVACREQEATFRERAACLQDQIWQCLEYRDAAGPSALRTLHQLGGTNPRQAVFPVVFTSALGLDDGTGLYGTLGQLGKVSYALTQTPQVSLDYQAHETNGALEIIWDYVSGLFPNGLPEAMLERYVAFLELLADDTTGVVWDTAFPDWLGPAVQQVIDKANATRAPVPSETLQVLFTKRTREAPNRVAVITRDRSISYACLHAWANAVAAVLGAAEGERRVCVLIEKGIEQVAAVWGALFAGAAYVPLDGRAPDSRLGTMIADVEPTALLCLSDDQPRAETLAKGAFPVISVDPLDPGEGGPLEVGEPPVAGTSRDLAYILYTSGSTGCPKGVAVEQVSVVNRMTDVIARYKIGAEDTAFAISALHHDLSVFDLFGMLAVAGGALAIPASSDTRNPAAWLSLIDRANASVWNSVPAFAEMLCEYVGPDQAPVDTASLRLFVLSGDRIPPDLPKRLRRMIRGVRIVSSGGPTETTVWDVHYPIDPATPTPAFTDVGTNEEPGAARIPYGYPLSNAFYHILDEQLRERPLWAVGELCSGGVGLARGYWRRPDLTATRFILHPRSGARLYLSGDLGYRDADGIVHILGRKDFQIKLNGERIEAGEIEAVLNSHPAVQDSVVSDASGPDGRQYLVAHVHPRPPVDARTSATPIEGVEITDPGMRVQFKNDRLALRTDLCSRPAVALEAAHPLPAWTARATRTSTRRFAARRLSVDDLARLLGALAALDLPGQAFPKYAYASAGGLYPVQTYVQVRGAVDGIAPGFYYFHPCECRLYLTAEAAQTPDVWHVGANAEMVSGAPIILYLVSRERAMRPLYGAKTRDFCLLEAGYMGQLLMTAAAPLGLGLCAIGFFRSLELPAVLGLESDQEVLHSFVCGPLPLYAEDVAPPGQPVGADDLCTALRTHAAANLPAHMVPSVMVLTADWPLNAAGKVDRRRLQPANSGPNEAAPESALPRAPQMRSKGKPPGAPIGAAPADSLETALCVIFQDVLGLDSFGPEDRYRERGADSLTLVRIHRRLRETTGHVMPLSALFEADTPRALRRYLTTEGA